MRMIHIARWDDFQHPDVNRTERVPWIKSYTRQLDDWRYQDLTPVQRALLHDLRLEYAITRRQVPDSTSWLARRFGYSVRRRSLEALNQAGFITFSASSVQADCKRAASLDTEGDTDTPPTPPVENSKNQAPAAQNESRLELVKDNRPGADDAHVGSPPRPAGGVGSSDKPAAARPRDELWDVLEAELGPVTTQSERGRRNRAVKELRAAGATADEVRERVAAARAHWSFPLGDMALVANWGPLGKLAAEGVRRRTTGYRLVRGSHGTTYVRDEAGTDRPPAGAA